MEKSLSDTVAMETFRETITLGNWKMFHVDFDFMANLPARWVNVESCHWHTKSLEMVSKRVRQMCQSDVQISIIQSGPAVLVVVVKAITTTKTNGEYQRNHAHQHMLAAEKYEHITRA
ncbi:hypothetical protein HUJ05_007697 [Dendroctonus ponderosae]|nr:hypothetical protein HUJ05_007697 [Dendroctonus ponderosae]